MATLPLATTPQAPTGVTWCSEPVDPRKFGITDTGLVEREAAPAALTYPQASLLLVGGLYGVGKTTFARRLCPPESVVDADQLAADHDLLPFLTHFQAIFELLFDAVEQRLQDGQPAVVTLPGLHGWQREQLHFISSQAGAGFHAIYLDGDPELSAAGQRARIAERPDLIASDVVISAYRQWVSLQSGFAIAKALIDSGEQADALQDAVYGLDSAVVLDRASADQVQRITFA